MPDYALEADEHEVPTQLGQRVPIMPFHFPFDLSERQVYAAGLGMAAASQVMTDTTNPDRWWQTAALLAISVVWVALERALDPTPEYWIWAVLDYVVMIAVSIPLWAWRPVHFLHYWLIELYRCARGLRLPRAEQANRWPLAVLPKWISRELLALPTIQPNGLLKFAKGGYGAVVLIQPRPNPDWLPMIRRQAIIAARRSILRKIRGDWSLHLQVRTFERELLEIASGPAWEFVRDNLAPKFVVRLPYLVVRQKTEKAVRHQTEALLKRFASKRMSARQLDGDELEQQVEEIWDAAGMGWLSRGQLRVGIKRLVAGRRVFKTFLIREFPRIAHLAWLRPLTGENLLVDIAIHIKTRRPGPTRRSLQRRMRHWIAMDNDFEYQQAAADAADLIQRMRRNEDTEVEAGVYITAMEHQAREVSEAIETAQCEFSAANLIHHRGRVATLLTGVDRVERPMHLDLTSVVVTDLLATGTYWPKGATLWGRALDAPEPVGINLFDTDNMNWAMFIAIIQGGGKTASALTMAWRMANPHPKHPLHDSGLQIVSVDFKPSRDYEPLFRNLAARGHKAAYNSWTNGPLPPIEGHMGFNLSDVPEIERATRILELGERLREYAAKHRYMNIPMLLLLDEVIALAEIEEGAHFMQEFGTQGRSENIAPVFMTQHPGPVLAHPKAQLAFANAGHVFLGRQNPAGLAAMQPLLALDDETMVMLSDADEGSGLLRVERRDGPVMIGVHVEPSPWELFEFGSNPDERARRWQRDQQAAQQSRRNGRAARIPKAA